MTALSQSGHSARRTAVGDASVAPAVAHIEIQPVLSRRRASSLALSDWAWLLLFFSAVVLPAHGLVWNKGYAHEPTTPWWIRILRDLALATSILLLVKPVWRARAAVRTDGWRSLFLVCIPLLVFVLLGIIHMIAGRNVGEVFQHEWRNPLAYVILITLSVTLYSSRVFTPGLMIAIGVSLCVWFLILAWSFPRMTMEWDEYSAARLIGHFERAPNLAFVLVCLGLWSFVCLNKIQPVMRIAWVTMICTCIILTSSVAGLAASLFALCAVLCFARMRRLIVTVRGSILIGILSSLLLVVVLSFRLPIPCVDRFDRNLRSFNGMEIESSSWRDREQSILRARELSSSGASSLTSRELQHRMVWANLSGNGWFEPVERWLGDFTSLHYVRFDSQYLAVAHNSGYIGLLMLAAAIGMLFYWIRIGWRRDPSARDELTLLLLIAVLVLGPFWMTAAFQQRFPINFLTFLLISRVWWLAFAADRSVNTPITEKSI